MIADLADLLRRRQIVHPTRIAALEAGHRRLRITIAGFPWWREGAVGEDGQIVLSFEGIAQGLLDAATLFDMEDDEALEIFSVSPLSKEPWAAGGTSYATYCSGPLPDPLNLFALVEDYLWNVGAPCSARDFLNLPHGSISGFREMTGSRSYLVATAPQPLHELVTAELQRQAVPHNVLTSERPPAPGLFVRIGDASFVCERATAEI